MTFPVERSDLATIDMPRPQEKRRARLVASVDQNSIWWNRLTAKRSDMGLVRTKLEKPTSLNPGSGFSLAFPISMAKKAATVFAE